MKEPRNDFFLKLIGIVILIFALMNLLGSFSGDGSIFGKLLAALFWAVALAAAIGFLRERGWAFLFVSVCLLGYFMSTFIRFVLAFDRPDESIGGAAWPLIISMILIGYLGREKMELRFRPELDVDHH